MKLLLSVRGDFSIRCHEITLVLNRIQSEDFPDDVFVPNGRVVGKNQTDQQGVTVSTRALICRKEKRRHWGYSRGLSLSHARNLKSYHVTRPLMAFGLLRPNCIALFIRR